MAYSMISTRIAKGDTIFVPILAMNRRNELWGEDAQEFKPERWSNLPESIKDIPGAWGSQMTFLYGPRACIGYRFALME
jgi:cytochrome P450